MVAGIIQATIQVKPIGAMQHFFNITDSGRLPASPQAVTIGPGKQCLPILENQLTDSERIYLAQAYDRLGEDHAYLRLQASRGFYFLPVDSVVQA